MPFTFRKSDIPHLDLDIGQGSNFTSWKEEWDAYLLVSGLSKEKAATQDNVKHCKRVNNKFKKSYDLPLNLLQYRKENSAEYLYS